MLRNFGKRIINAEVIFFLIVWLAIMGLFRERAFFDPGSLWHIRVGEIILHDGFPTTDPFTFTHRDKTWIPQQWGAEIAMALLHGVDKLDTLLLAFATGIAMLFTWIFRRMRHAGMNPLLAGIMTSGCLFCAAFHFVLRPHMVTIALIAVTMAFLIDVERGRRSIAFLAWLIPIFILWTNLHGGVLGGVMNLGIAIAGWGLIFLARKIFNLARKKTDTMPIDSWRNAWLLAAVGIVCLMTPFINPFGMELLNTWQRIVGSPVLKQIVNEHKPLDIMHPAGQVTIGYGVFYLLILAGSLNRWPRITWLIPLVWLVLSIDSIRQGPLFILCGVICIADIWPHTCWHRLLKKHGDSLIVEADTIPRWRWTHAIIPLLAIVIALSLQLTKTQLPVIGHGWACLDSDMIPTALTEKLQTYAKEQGNNAKIYNDLNHGGYLIYHSPELKIYMDDRFELYTAEWTKAYAAMYFDHPERIAAILDQYNLDMALIVTSEEPTPLDEWFSKQNEWEEVGRTKSAALFQRRP